MTKNLLSELARERIPPPPANLPREVHQRINERLATQHVVDFVVRALPTALIEFLQALAASIWYSLCPKDSNHSRNSNEKGTDL